MSTLIKKIFADLWGNKTRSILVALSIAVGVFAVGVIISSMMIVKKDMEADYFSTNPHTARIYSQDFDDILLDELKVLPEVESVDASYNLWLKIASSAGNLYKINLNSITSIDAIQVDRIVLESGDTDLSDDAIYLERQGAEGLGLKIGQKIKLSLQNGEIYEVKLAGTVHDVQANPFKFNSSTSGFVTPATMEKLGGSRLNNFVNLVTSGSHSDADHVRQMAEQVAEIVSANGVTVVNVNVNRPGEHPAQATLDTVMKLLQALSVLVVLLSTFLVMNTVTAFMGQQIRQIGVMKAVGATFSQVVSIYLGLVIAYGLLALLIAIPLGALASYGFSRWLIGMMNANPSSFRLPMQTVFIQLILGLIVPVLGALIPIIRGSKRTVREAITSYGLNSNRKSGIFDRILEINTWLPRPLMLSIRNTFTRKARLVLTLATLILGGAIFIAVLGVRESMYKEVDQTMAYSQSDVNASFPESYPSEELATAVNGLAGVTSSEGWISSNANVVRPDNRASDLIAIYVPPVNTNLLKASMIDGRWLEPGDTDTIVVSNHFVDIRPDVKVGDTIVVTWQDHEKPFKVKGIFRMTGTFPAPFTYITPAGYAALGGDPNQVNQLKIVTDIKSQSRQEEVLNSIQSQFKDLGIRADLQTGFDLKNQQRSTVNI